MSCFIVQGLSKSDWMFFDINRFACKDVVGLFKGWHLFSPVYPEVFLLDVLDNQVVPLHLELFRHRQRLGVILWILWWNRPGHSALVAGLACQGSIMPYLGFCKYRFLLLRKLTRKRFFHPQHTSARPMPRTAATKSSLRLPLILIQMYLKQTKGIFLSQLSQKLLLVNKERMAPALGWLACIRASRAVVKSDDRAVAAESFPWSCAQRSQRFDRHFLQIHPWYQHHVFPLLR